MHPFVSAYSRGCSGARAAHAIFKLGLPKRPIVFVQEEAPCGEWTTLRRSIGANGVGWFGAGAAGAGAFGAEAFGGGLFGTGAFGGGPFGVGSSGAAPLPVTVPSVTACSPVAAPSATSSYPLPTPKTSSNPWGRRRSGVLGERAAGGHPLRKARTDRRANAGERRPPSRGGAFAAPFAGAPTQWWRKLFRMRPLRTVPALTSSHVRRCLRPRCLRPCRL